MADSRRGPGMGLAAVATIAVAAAAGRMQDVVRPLAVEPAWIARLEALRPQAPMDYFELAEEIADRAAVDADVELARDLFGLAGALDPSRLGPSACLALADLSTREHAKRRLRALAMLLDERAEASWPGDDRADGTRASTDAALAVAEAFSDYRRGLGSRAQAVLRRPGARELLQSLDHLLPGGVDRFLADARVYRAGERAPQLSRDDETLMLRLEAALLAGEQRQWSGELLLEGGQPLIEVDPERLSEMLGADPARPFYRRGRWTTQPGRPTAEPRQ